MHTPTFACHHKIIYIYEKKQRQITHGCGHYTIQRIVVRCGRGYTYAVTCDSVDVFQPEAPFQRDSLILVLIIRFCSFLKWCQVHWHRYRLSILLKRMNRIEWVTKRANSNGIALLSLSFFRYWFQFLVQKSWINVVTFVFVWAQQQMTKRTHSNREK